jgi:RNA polymerase sigma factor (sigma-70 family)
MAEPSELLLQNLTALQQVITATCRHKGMRPDDIEEFSGVVRLRLVENDYAVIRAYQGRSSFKTFLASVVTRMLIDHQRHEWGKWRGSAGAERLGEVAVELERLLHRDGHPLEEALAVVCAHHPELTRVQLIELSAQLAPRNRRTVVTLEEAGDIPFHEADRIENADTAARISQIVVAFIAALPRAEQLVFKLRFDSAMSVTEISRSLHLQYGPLWRGLQKRFQELRQRLERAGIGNADIEKLVGSEALLDFQLKNCAPRPSEDDESSVAARQEDMSS